MFNSTNRIKCITNCVSRVISKLFHENPISSCLRGFHLISIKSTISSTALDSRAQFNKDIIIHYYIINLYIHTRECCEPFLAQQRRAALNFLISFGDCFVEINIFIYKPRARCAANLLGTESPSQAYLFCYTSKYMNHNDYVYRKTYIYIYIHSGYASVRVFMRATTPNRYAQMANDGDCFETK